MLATPDIDYSLLPEHIRGGVQRYIENGIRPGDFLQAVISNDLRESFIRADDTNIERMYDIICFFYNQAPLNCWGSAEHLAAWMKKGGLLGKEKGDRPIQNGDKSAEGENQNPDTER